jgi:glutamyl-tRNA synthetase
MTPPRYGHVPLLVAPDGRRLSKRDHDLSLQALRENNVSPKAVVGLLASYIGLAEGGEEIDAAEFERRFSWDAIRSHREDIQADASVLLPR